MSIYVTRIRKRMLENKKNHNVCFREINQTDLGIKTRKFIYPKIKKKS